MNDRLSDDISFPQKIWKTWKFEFHRLRNLKNGEEVRAETSCIFFCLRETSINEKSAIFDFCKKSYDVIVTETSEGDADL